MRYGDFLARKYDLIIKHLSCGICDSLTRYMLTSRRLDEGRIKALYGYFIMAE